MISQIGTVSSYKELGEQFLNFVQKSNDTTVPWEVIDDRLDEFYGATIKFPVSDVSDEFSIVDPINELKSINKFDIIEGALVPLYDDDYTSYCYCNTNNSIYYAVYRIPFFDMGLSPSVDKVYRFNYDVDNLEVVDSISNHTDSPIVLAFSFTPIIYLMETEDSLVEYYTKQYNALVKYLSDNNINKKIFSIAIIAKEAYLGRDGHGSIADSMRNIMDDYVEKVKSVNFPLFLFDFRERNFYSEGITYTGYAGLSLEGVSDTGYSTTAGSYVNYYISSISGRTVLSYTNRVHPDYHEEWGIIAEHFQPSFTYKFLGTAKEIKIISYMTGGYNDFLVSAIPLASCVPTNESGSGIPSKFNVSRGDLSPYINSYAYISLQYNKITSTTYNEWLTNTKDNYMSESFDSRRKIPAFYNNSETWRDVTISNQYQNNIANIFKDTGEVLFISPHIKYDNNLWMCEQGGIACDQETRTQNIEDNVIRHRKLTSNFSGYPTQEFVKVPPFPSLGCPMFTINNAQLSQENINYYFIRDNHSASIVVYVPVTDSMTYNYTVQHMSFGVLDCFSISEQFMYPLYVAGGNGGLCQEHWSYYNPWGGSPNHEVGNMYKLDMENITMSNSNILLSAKFNGANVSNFRVLCPDGHWDNIFNVTQNVSLIVDPDECHPTAWTPRYYMLQKPVVGGSELGDSRYGGTTTLNGANSIKRIDTGYIDPGYKDSIVVEYAKTFHANALVQPVMPVFSSHKELSGEGWPRHRYGVIGKIPRCYSTWSRHLKFGELEIGGKRFLSIPSAYDHRTWYPAYKTSVGLANLEAEAKAESKRGDIFYNDYIYDYLLLKLED